jgi:LacI family transcriptional regulator
VAAGKRVGIKAVAARAGVSVGTVSHVLNHPDTVRASTRERVEAAMVELGFVRNSAAGALRAGRSTAIGLVVLDIGNPFFTEVARGAQEAATAAGHTLLLCSSDESLEQQEAHLRFLEEQRVAGVLLSPVLGLSPRSGQLVERGTPLVTVDAPGRPGACSVAGDDRAGGRLAGQHLLELGARRITWVTGPASIRQTTERGLGLHEAVTGTKAGLQVLEIPVLRGEAGLAAVPEVLKTRPDAIVCANDVVALGVLRGLLEAGVDVPGDVALVGYDDIEFAATAAVPLTSVRQPARDLGRTATQFLLEELLTPATHTHRQAIFVPELVVRRSSEVRLSSRRG